MTQNNTKIKNNEIALEASPSRKSSLETCQVQGNQFDLLFDTSRQSTEGCSIKQNKWNMSNKISSWKIPTYRKCSLNYCLDRDMRTGKILKSN